ncbi:MAG: nucleotide exchange factor GrpE [Candidatus Levybacteria bacterium RIFCSPHIGHO2_01_FULL_40_15b]|nr:MAG: nucleotide exchange factor GrpE [Candidatus Levybacteria bacterium RIFCSPHIGHO2_01_FULL_40_15b]
MKDDNNKQDSTKSSGRKKSDQIKSLEQRVTELEEQLARAVADYRNLEKRFEDEKREFVKFANRDLLLRLIPAFDTLVLAEKYVTDEGIKITIKHLQESLRDVGVEKIQTEDQIFNPETMEALSTSEGEENKVLEELRPGYTLNGKLLRPAQVKVGKQNQI